MNENYNHLKDYFLKRKLEISVEILGADKLSYVLLANRDKNVKDCLNEIFKAASWLNGRIHNECKSYKDDSGEEYEFEYLLDGFYDATMYQDGALFHDCVICESEYQKTIVGLTPLDK